MHSSQMKIRNSLIKEKVLKFEALDKLLADPDILAVFPQLATLLFDQSRAANRAQMKLSVTIGQKRGRKPGGFGRKALAIVTTSMAKM